MPRLAPRRQEELLRIVQESPELTDKEVAVQMGIGESAVKHLLQKLYRKHGVGSRRGLLKKIGLSEWIKMAEAPAIVLLLVLAVGCCMCKPDPPPPTTAQVLVKHPHCADDTAPAGRPWNDGKCHDCSGKIVGQPGKKGEPLCVPLMARERKEFR